MKLYASENPEIAIINLYGISKEEMGRPLGTGMFLSRLEKLTGRILSKRKPVPKEGGKE